MKISFLAVILSLHWCNAAYSQESKSNYFAAVNSEVDLVRSLFVETNAAFDEKVCAALSLSSDTKIEISYLQVSFAFFYPRTNDVGPSFAEMVIPFQLVGKIGRIQRSRIPTNEIPLNYIRVFDPSGTRPTAELEILVAVSDNATRNQRFVRRSFEFVYEKSWKLTK